MKPDPLDPQISDTDPASKEIQCRIFREMPPWRKIELVEDANRVGRILALAGIALRNPDATVSERERLLMDILLGKEEALRVYGPHARRENQ